MDAAQQAEYDRLLAAKPYAGVKAMNLTVFEKGQIKGRQEVHLKILHKQLAKKFGHLPNGAVERLKQLSLEELEAIFLALGDATSLEELGLASE